MRRSLLHKVRQYSFQRKISKIIKLRFGSYVNVVFSLCEIQYLPTLDNFQYFVQSISKECIAANSVGDVHVWGLGTWFGGASHITLQRFVDVHEIHLAFCL